MVELNRTAYQEPELPLSPKKSEVILAKKTVLIGEVVNGGPLPNPPQHQPVCSFDSQNKYGGEASPTEVPHSQFKGIDHTNIYISPFSLRLIRAVCVQFWSHI